MTITNSTTMLAMLWLMSRAGFKPVIEYCGGTELGNWIDYDNDDDSNSGDSHHYYHLYYYYYYDYN